MLFVISCKKYLVKKSQLKFIMLKNVQFLMMLCSYSFMPNLESMLNVINNATILDQDEWNAAKIYHSISLGSSSVTLIFTFFSMILLVIACRVFCSAIRDPDSDLENPNVVRGRVLEMARINDR